MFEIYYEYQCSVLLRCCNFIFVHMHKLHSYMYFCELRFFRPFAYHMGISITQQLQHEMTHVAMEIFLPLIPSLVYFILWL